MQQQAGEDCSQSLAVSRSNGVKQPPGNRMLSKTLRNKFFPSQPKAEALVYSQGSNQQSQALGVFLIPRAMAPCTPDEGFSPEGMG